MRDSELLSLIKPHFDIARIESGHVVVNCPACLARGKRTKDLSGHLRLHSRKMVGHCVRCGYSIGKLRPWLRKRNIAVLGFDDEEEEDETPRSYPRHLHRCELPENISALRDHKSVSTLIGRGLTEDYIEIYDLRCISDRRWKGWVAFPFYEDEELVYYQLRRNEDGKKHNFVPEMEPFGKARWLYNIDQAVIGGVCIICEGPLDVISVQMELDRTGLWETCYVVGLLGTTISRPKADLLDSQIGKLLMLRPSKVLVLLDDDATSHSLDKRSPARTLANELEEFGFSTDVVDLEKGDPNKFVTDNPGKLHDLILPHIPTLELAPA